MLERTNLLGALAAVVFYVFVILVFVFRLVGRPQHVQWIGLVWLLLILLLGYLLLTARQLARPVLYYVQIGLTILFLLVELLLDYVLNIEFRSVE